ncbi:23S rRNA (adenine(1618)-N(6))-methyltransferase RlmF [Neotamlana sargassicola]|uniref:23S rRNA (adenine(1618)-N(6))-methyltransferase RlmF n=1 Tax=Neotamlana sargassicola TaxID=2883125 RepID=UPI00293D2665|nr:23S rRNA (adenine(1618)-N(6))-methyltransferase RlmF [Tamlana sargassicola]
MKRKAALHPNNEHQAGYNLNDLCLIYPELEAFVVINKYGNQSIDFANPNAVKALNKALLFKYYHVKFWDFSDVNLCPPVPGRADYIHYLNDLVNEGKQQKNIKVLDIGTGATCIYPLLGNAIYNWSFVATDIDKTSLKNAQNIIDKNDLGPVIKLRYQENSQQILKGIIKSSDAFTVSMCNPPFYKDEAEANVATLRKLKGLKASEKNELVRNFSGTTNELIYKGGEKAFLHNYIYQSSLFKNHCIWFTSLVSKKELIKDLNTSLTKLGAVKIKVINMGQGQKISRILAWTFINE